MKTLIALTAITFLSLSGSAALQAETLIGFDFNGYQNSGSAASSSNAVGVNASSLSLPTGSGLSNNNQYPGNYDVRGDSDSTLAAAETDKDYIAFTVTPTAGKIVDVTDLSFVAASFGGDANLVLTDSSNNVLGTASLGDSSSAQGGYQQSVTLTLASGDTFNTATSFRLYAYGNLNVDSFTPPSEYTLLFNNGGNDSYDINGTVTNAPEPTTIALGIAGALMLAVVVMRRRVSLR